MIHTYNYFIIPICKSSYSFIYYLITQFIYFCQLNCCFQCFLKFEKSIQSIKYYIKRHTASIEDCYSRELLCDVLSTFRQIESRFLDVETVILSFRNLWLIITFSCLTFELLLLHIFRLFCFYGFAPGFAFSVTVKVKIITARL